MSGEAFKWMTLLCSGSAAASAGAQAIEPPVAPATQPRQAEEDRLEDIIVTATRREERLQDIPVSVTAVTGKTLGGAGITHVRELTQVVPGLYGGRNASVNQPVIRGVGSSGVSVGDESNVATYIDGIYQADPFSTSLDLVEVERVEVLRGPQGTVFGRNATGGLINIITPDPSFTARGRVSGKVGGMRNDANSYDLRAYVTGGLARGLAADLAMLYRKNDGYIDNLVTGGYFGSQRVISVRSKLLFAPTDRMQFILTGEYADSNDEQPAFQPYNGNTAGRRFPSGIIAKKPFQISYDFEPKSDYERYNLSLRTRFEFDSFNLETSTGYMRTDIEQHGDSDASNVRLGYTDIDVKPRTISQEVRILSTDGGRFNWIVGAYAFHLRGTMPAEVGNTPGPPVPVTRSFFSPRLRTTSYAGFAEGTYEIADRLFLTVGGRYTTEDRTFRQTFNGNPLPFGKAKTSFNKFTYRGALRYEFADDANIYVTHGTGFKSGVFNALGLSPQATQPETITAYEVGLKIDPLDWLRTNASAYYYDYKDLQVTARSATGSFVLQNAATAEVYGGEIEIIASPFADLDLRASAAYTHAEYSKFEAAQIFKPRPDGGNTIAVGNVSGNSMTRAPRYTVSLGANYGWDMGGGRGDLTANFYRSSKVYYDFLNVAKQKAYSLLNGEVGWTTPDEAWRFSLWATNITDAEVYQQLQPGGPATTAIYQKPRVIGIGAQVSF